MPYYFHYDPLHVFRLEIARNNFTLSFGRTKTDKNLANFSFKVRAVSERTFGSDSGLEQSGDELEATREVEVHEAEEEEESMEDLNVALPDEGEDTEEETVESLQTGDLGVDRATTFRVQKEQPPLDMELDALADEFSEPLPNEEDESEEDEGEREEEEETSSVSRKLADLGVSEEEEGVSNMLSELTQGSRSHEMARR